MKTLVESIVAKGIDTAIFDIDNTLSKTNILKTYIYLKKKSLLNKAWYMLWLCQFFIIKVPVYLCLDTLSRDLFLKHFYKKFNRGTYTTLERGCKDYFREKVTKLFISDTVQLLNLFKEAELKIVLVSLGISPLVQEYATFFGAEYFCIPIKNKNNIPVVVFDTVSNFKLNQIKKYNASTIVAIADSIHDKDMLCYSENSIIVSHGKAKKWMKSIRGAYILQVT